MIPPSEERPLVVESPMHGDVADWNPPAPATVDDSEFSRESRRRLSAVSAEEATVSPAPPELAAPPGPKRAFSLDALRGLFLISMTMGFTVSTSHLPTWMYHRQFPFQAEAPVNVAGISWRDLAYASFLFTMAAALPLTLSRRIEKGEMEIGIVVAALKRFALLLVYALVIGHANTFMIGYTQTTRVISLAGFCVLGLIFTRRRPDWNERTFRIVNRVGWLLAVAFVTLTPMVYGQNFSFARTDDIIAGLAFASLFGSLGWYFTRNNPVARLALLALAVAMYLGAKGDGWISQFWFDWPAEWLFSAQRFVIFATVIPGTIAGDLILRWMRSEKEPTSSSWSPQRVGALALICAAFTPVVTAALYNRYVEAATAYSVAAIVAGVFLTWNPTTPVERLMRSLFNWAAFWLVVGLLLEPSEGGIHKVPDTLSYYFTVTGTTSMLLVALTAITDALRHAKWVATLIDVGHNPLLLYVLFPLLINPLLEMIPPLRPFMMGSIPLEITRYAIEVVIVVAFVRLASRHRVYWRT